MQLGYNFKTNILKLVGIIKLYDNKKRIDKKVSCIF
jgi:hypothetical protein